MSSVIRIVNYAINGSGVGHLTRLVAINRWIRRYAAHAGVRAEIYFLTSSEADHLLFEEHFASFKLPSKTVVGETAIDKVTYLALAKQWVWHSIGLIRPDLLVVDTFPRGSFGELLSTLDLCRRRAFIYRPLKKSFAQRPDFQAMLPLYDAIIVPDLEGSTDLPVPESVRHRVLHTGPAVVRERVELPERAEVRARLCIPEDRLAVYLSAGGGGDPTAERQLHQLIELLGVDPTLHLVIGAGPLYRGERRYGEGVLWLAGLQAVELMKGFDLAICAAGYNTFFELMHAGVPTIFLPQEKIADDQRARAERAARVGAGVVLTSGSPTDGGCCTTGDFFVDLTAAVDRWRDPEARDRARSAAQALVPRNHARDIAAELLGLVLSEAQVEQARGAITEELLGTAVLLGLELDPFLEVVRAIELHLAPPEGRVAADGQATALSVGLLRQVLELEVPIPQALRVIGALGRKAHLGSLEERAAAAGGLLAALAPFADWAGAVTLMKVFSAERRLTPQEFTAELCAYLELLRDRRMTLYSGIEHLSLAQGDGRDQPSNRELLRAAAERCR